MSVIGVEGGLLFKGVEKDDTIIQCGEYSPHACVALSQLHELKFESSKFDENALMV